MGRLQGLQDLGTRTAASHYRPGASANLTEKYAFTFPQLHKSTTAYAAGAQASDADPRSPQAAPLVSASEGEASQRPREGRRQPANPLRNFQLAAGVFSNTAPDAFVEHFSNIFPACFA